MKFSWRDTALVSTTAILCFLGLVRAGQLSAQDVYYGGGDTSVPEILEQQRQGYGLLYGIGLLASLMVEAEEWPRARLDSLSQGLVQLLFEGSEHPPGALFGQLAHVAADGRPVGSLDQFLEIYEFALNTGTLPPARPIRMVAHFPDDPRAILFLRRIVVTDVQINHVQRWAAIQALAKSERGRDVLRVLHNSREVANGEARSYLAELARRDFRLNPGGGGI